jgi:NAD(P)-dependent dehydrogenase (short-subunit alcohol dehydrogenase family)
MSQAEPLELAGRVAVVTGAGRGLGAAHAQLLAARGVQVVVNDLGAASDGAGADRTPAQQVVDAIRAGGGEAIVNTDDVSTEEGAAGLVAAAISEFGRLDVLVNNAGILRDRMMVNMSFAEWDDVIRVHLRGHFAPAHHAIAHWRERAKAGDAGDPVLINTTSTSGLLGSAGQANYAAAKAGIAAFTQICHLELHQRYGVRSYAIAPGARTRLTLGSPGADEAVKAPETGFDFWEPGNVSPLVAWLSAAGCPTPSGSVFHAQGDEVSLFRPWAIESTIRNDREAWTVEDLGARMDELFATTNPWFPAGADSAIPAEFL